MVIRCRETEEYEVEMNVMVNNELMKKLHILAELKL